MSGCNKILLQPITIDNWRDVIALGPGIQNQSFIEPNHVTLLEIMFRFPTTYHNYLRGIYCNDQLVGFTAFYHKNKDHKDHKNYKNIYIHTFMIDQRFQGNGLGKSHLGLFLTIFGNNSVISKQSSCRVTIQLQSICIKNLDLLSKKMKNR